MLPIFSLTKLAKRGSPMLSSQRGLIEKSYAGTRSKEGEAAEERLETPIQFDRWQTLCTVSWSDWQASCYFRHPGALTLSVCPT